MKQSSRIGWGIGVVLLAACASKEPLTPMSLRPPAPPEAAPGSVRVYGAGLAHDREEEIRKTLRDAEAKLLVAYDDYRSSDLSLAGSTLTEGRLQVRIGINKDGKVASVHPVYSEVNEGVIGAVRRVLLKLSFAPGSEAWVYDTFRFEHEPLEVLKIGTDFDRQPPAIVALVENRSKFHLNAISAEVTVLGPEKSKPLRRYRRRVNDSFVPGGRHELRIPIGSEWATARNSFVVVVRAAVDEESEPN